MHTDPSVCKFLLNEEYSYKVLIVYLSQIVTIKALGGVNQGLTCDILYIYLSHTNIIYCNKGVDVEKFTFITNQKTITKANCSTSTPLLC